MQKHLFGPNLSAQISVFAGTKSPKTIIGANQNAQISVFAFGKLVSRWFCPK